MYRIYGDDTWQVLKEKNNISMLYRTYNEYDAYYDASSNGIQSSNTSSEEIILLHNGKKIRDIPVIYYQKKWLLQFVNKRYQQQFKKNHFNNKEQILDYMMTEESKKVAG